MKLNCQGISKWLKQRDMFTSVVVVGGGFVLTAAAVGIAIPVIIEGGQIPSLPGGWMLLATGVAAVLWGVMHHTVSRFDADGELSYNGLQEHLKEQEKEFNQDRAKKATTASVAECLALGALASTIMSSFGADILSSIAVLGIVPVVVHLFAGQQLTKWNYQALEKFDGTPERS
jgi:hypothetical protein